MLYISADNVLGWEIVLKISHLLSKLRFSVKCSFFGRSLSRGHYQPIYQPPEGVYLLNNWIGDHEISKLAKNICFKSRKKDTKTSTEGHEWNGMTQNGLFDIFQQRTCVNAIYFAPVVTTVYRMKNDKSSTRGVSLKMSVLAKARAQLFNILYINTHLSVPHGENI